MFSVCIGEPNNARAEPKTFKEIKTTKIKEGKLFKVLKELKISEALLFADGKYYTSPDAFEYLD